jgi:ABC-type antimicrobial peptide transport system permease subunit
VLAVVAVVLITPALSFVVIGSLYNGVTVWTQMQALPQYLSDTFLHGNLGVTGPHNTPLRDDVLEGLPVDVALLIGGLVCGVMAGVATGVVSAIRHRRPSTACWASAAPRR